MTKKTAAKKKPKPFTLRIHFQGLCAFIRNHESFEKSDEVCVLLLNSDAVKVKPKLCRHEPILSLLDVHALALPPGFKGVSCVVPGDAGRRPSAANFGVARMAMQLVPLRGFDLWIVGAERGGQVPVSTGKDQNMKNVLAVEALTGQKAIPKGLVTDRKPSKIVAGRIFLRGGKLKVTKLTKKDEFVLGEDGQPPQQGSSIVFAQELVFTYRMEEDVAQLARRKFGSNKPHFFSLGVFGEKQRIDLGVSNLCTVTDAIVREEGGEIEQDREDDGRDSLSYRAIVGTDIDPRKLRVIMRKPKRGGFPAKAGLDACPPASSHLGT